MSFALLSPKDTCHIQTFSYEYLHLVAETAAVNPNGVETLLASGFSTSPIKGNPVFSNDSKALPKNPPDCHIICN